MAITETHITAATPLADVPESTNIFMKAFDGLTSPWKTGNFGITNSEAIWSQALALIGGMVIGSVVARKRKNQKPVLGFLF